MANGRTVSAVMQKTQDPSRPEEQAPDIEGRSPDHLDAVDREIQESFPASDPPSWALGVPRGWKPPDELPPAEADGPTEAPDLTDAKEWMTGDCD